MNETVFGPLGLLGVLCSFGMLQGLALSLVFFLRRQGDEVANRILGVLFLLISWHLVEVFLWVTGLIARFPYVDSTGYPLTLAIGPVYLFYTRRILQVPKPFGWKSLVHFVPLVAFWITYIDWILTPPIQKQAFYEQVRTGGADGPGPTLIFWLCTNISLNCFYLVWTNRMIRRTETRARDRLSDAVSIAGLVALRRTTFGFAVYTVLHLMMFVGLVASKSGAGSTVDTIWAIALSAFINFNAYAAIARPDSFARSIGELREDPVAPPAPRPEALDAEATSDPDEPSHPKYRHSTLTDDEISRISARLTEVLREKQLFRDGSLTLRATAAEIDVRPHHLSQVINQGMGRTFFDVVNEHRVEEAMRLLADPQRARDTILAIAFESGFNNKTSFNQAFRKFVGQPPSAYRREHVPGR